MTSRSLGGEEGERLIKILSMMTLENSWSGNAFQEIRYIYSHDLASNLCLCPRRLAVFTIGGPWE